jgi:uncharacterized protein YhfF
MSESMNIEQAKAEIRRLKFALVRARQARERDGDKCVVTLSKDNHRLRTELAEVRERCQSAMKILGFALKESATDVTVEEWKDFTQRAFDELGEPDTASTPGL